MRDTRQRQLIALAVAAAWHVAAFGAFARAAAQPAAPGELAAARLLERAVLARGATADEVAKMRGLYEELEAKHPRDAAVKNAHAEFLWNAEMRDAAIGRWRAAERLEPGNAAVLNHLGGASVAAGEMRAALGQFLRASEAEPANPLYHFNAANVAFVFRRDVAGGEEEAFATARHHFAEASRLAPANAEYARAYAEVFYALPKPDWPAALAAWEKVRTLSAKKEPALLHLARVHMKLGQKAEARACLAQVEGAEFARLKKRLAERIEAEP